MTTTIPCRAKDPHTCPYHSAEIRSNEALNRGDIDGYLVAQAQMTAAIKTTPEIVEFFAKQQAPKTEKPAAKTNSEKQTRELGIHRAWNSLPDRINAQYDNPAENFYTVGGSPLDTQNETWTTARTVYQDTAKRLLGLATREMHNGQPAYYVDKARLARALDIAKNDHLMDAEDGAQSPTYFDEVEAAHDFVKQQLGAYYEGIHTPGGDATRANLYHMLRTLDTAFWENPNAETPKPAPAIPAPVQRGFQQADRTRDARIKAHLDGSAQYLVGGTEEATADTEFTAARLVYQRAANLLLKNARYRKADGFEGYVVGINDFERDYRSLSDKTATELGLNDLAPQAEIDETHRTVDQVYRTLSGHFNKAPYGERTAVLNRSLRSLDLAFWNSPNGPTGERPRGL